MLELADHGGSAAVCQWKLCEAVGFQPTTFYNVAAMADEVVVLKHFYDKLYASDNILEDSRGFLTYRTGSSKCRTCDSVTRTS